MVTGSPILSIQLWNRSQGSESDSGVRSRRGSRGAFGLALALSLGFLGCGGGGGGGSASSTSTPVTFDGDPGSTPPADPGYYNVPSNPLGAVISGGNVTFRYWNPRATSVSVNLYGAWNTSLASPAATIPMSRGSNGIWSSASVPIPAQNFYVYSVGGTYLLDPYAKAMDGAWAWHESMFPYHFDNPDGSKNDLDSAPHMPKQNSARNRIESTFSGGRKRSATQLGDCSRNATCIPRRPATLSCWTTFK